MHPPTTFPAEAGTKFTDPDGMELGRMSHPRVVLIPDKIFPMFNMQDNVHTTIAKGLWLFMYRVLDYRRGYRPPRAM